MDIKDFVSNMIQTGYVSSIDASTGTARVKLPDHNDKVTAPLLVLQRGTRTTKDFWMPAVDDQVVCLLLSNASGKGSTAGFILGAVYSEVDAVPGGSGDTVRVLDHKGSMQIKCSGDISIESGASITLTAPTININ